MNERELEKAAKYMKAWREDWVKFVVEVLKGRPDREQQDIIYSVQYNPRTAVCSGTSRGKDWVSACCCLCFFYLTPRWDANGRLVGNTKVAMTAPTGRQVHNIMTPEVRRLFRNAGFLPGRLVADDIRTDYEEWFLTGFKAGDDATEAWSGFHAVNTMFSVTEASGISEIVYNAIEGNLQGNSRFLIVFNPNITTGYAAKAMKSDRFKKFRLSSLNAENVVSKKLIIPGQVDYDWVKDKVENWTIPILERDFNEGEGDFEWEGAFYRPNDLFRIKVLGMFPRVSSDILIPYEWVELANRRWLEFVEEHGRDYIPPEEPLRLGVDVAGMGRDSSNLAHRYGNFVRKIDSYQSAGKADHMHVAGMIIQGIHESVASGAVAMIDTIGEGAGVFSRLEELEHKWAISCKNSEGAKELSDITGQYTFANMRAYLHWCTRDWLDPRNGYNAMLPPDDMLAQELTEPKWKFQSNGSIIIEPKEDIQARLGRSPDRMDALNNTFYPHIQDNNAYSQADLIRMFR